VAATSRTGTSLGIQKAIPVFFNEGRFDANQATSRNLFFFLSHLLRVMVVALVVSPNSSFALFIHEPDA
jgi:hypothetical protein